MVHLFVSAGNVQGVIEIYPDGPRRGRVWGAQTANTAVSSLHIDLSLPLHPPR